MRLKKKSARTFALCSAAYLLAGNSLAAGHLDVDNATIMDPGQCQYETWYGRAGLQDTADWHLGPACRVGPVELHFNIDRYSAQGQHGVLLGPQVKWIWFGGGENAALSGAVSVGVSWDRTYRSKPGRQILFPFTWRALDSMQISANLGEDWSPLVGERTDRRGLGGEWAINPEVSLLAERNLSVGAWTSRAGLRYNFTPRVSVDLTLSRTGPGGVRGFYVGLNNAFGRP